MLITIKKICQKILNKNGPGIAPCDTQNIISHQLQYLFSTFILCFQLDK